MKIYIWKAPKLLGIILKLIFKKNVEYVGK